MSPLIDVSLVLLIFFMMTATVGSAVSLIKTPEAREGTQLTSDQSMLWIGVQMSKDRQPQPIYSMGMGSKGADANDTNLTLPQLLQRIGARLSEFSIIYSRSCCKVMLTRLFTVCEYESGHSF